MKRKDENLEKNISRLVKLAGDQNKPGKEFTDSLIEEALARLKSGRADHKRDRKDTIMTAKKIFAYAASVIVVAGVVFALVMPKLSSVKQFSHENPKSTSAPREQSEKQSGIKTERIVVSDYKAPERAEIKYTEVGVKPVEGRKIEMPGSSATSVDNSMVTKLSERGKLGVSGDVSKAIDRFSMAGKTGRGFLFP